MASSLLSRASCNWKCTLQHPVAALARSFPKGSARARRHCGCRSFPANVHVYDEGDPADTYVYCCGAVARRLLLQQCNIDHRVAAQYSVLQHGSSRQQQHSAPLQLIRAAAASFVAHSAGSAPFTFAQRRVVLFVCVFVCLCVCCSGFCTSIQAVLHAQGLAAHRDQAAAPGTSGRSHTAQPTARCARQPRAGACVCACALGHCSTPSLIARFGAVQMLRSASERIFVALPVAMDAVYSPLAFVRIAPQ